MRRCSHAADDFRNLSIESWAGSLFHSALPGVQLLVNELAEAVVSTKPAKTRLTESDQALTDF